MVNAIQQMVIVNAIKDTAGQIVLSKMLNLIYAKIKIVILEDA